MKRRESLKQATATLRYFPAALAAIERDTSSGRIEGLATMPLVRHEENA